MFRGLLKWTFRRLVRLYFRRIEVVGDAPAASTEGRLFVSNHWSALIDPVLVLTHAPCEISPVAKSTLWDIPGLRWLLDAAEAVPIVRRRDDPDKPAAANDALFDKIAAFLRRGGNILIFPEGTSHNEPRLAKLKTGAARMLLRARDAPAEDPNTRALPPLSYQAVGLEFDARQTFRSDVVVWYGKPRTVDEASTVEDIVETMRSDLADLVIEAETWEERRLILRLAELVRNEQGESSLSSAVGIAQDIERAKADLAAKHPELVADVRARVGTYFDALDRVGLRDEQLAAAPPRRKAPSLVRWLFVPLSLVGIALYYVPYQLPRLVARRSSEVDMHSTLKLATGLVAYPVWAGLLAACAWWFSTDVSFAVAATLVLIASPFAALDLVEHTEALSRSMRVAVRVRELTALTRLRGEALASVEEARVAIADIAQASLTSAESAPTAPLT